MIRHDLDAAGIPYRDASDRVADFHALRHSYITALAMSRPRSRSFNPWPGIRPRP